MKRSALKRHTYLQHGKPLKQTSDHRRREDEAARQPDLLIQETRPQFVQGGLDL